MLVSWCPPFVFHGRHRATAARSWAAILHGREIVRNRAVISVTLQGLTPRGLVPESAALYPSTRFLRSRTSHGFTRQPSASSPRGGTPARCRSRGAISSHSRLLPRGQCQLSGPRAGRCGFDWSRQRGCHVCGNAREHFERLIARFDQATRVVSREPAAGRVGHALAVVRRGTRANRGVISEQGRPTGAAVDCDYAVIDQKVDAELKLLPRQRPNRPVELIAAVVVKKDFRV